MNLELSPYEIVNLYWLLKIASKIGLETGDWCGMIRNKLRDNIHLDGYANWGDERTDDFVKMIEEAQEQKSMADFRYRVMKLKEQIDSFLKVP